MTSISFWDSIHQCRKCARLVDDRPAPFLGNAHWAALEHATIDCVQGRFFGARVSDFFLNIPDPCDSHPVVDGQRLSCVICDPQSHFADCKREHTGWCLQQPLTPEQEAVGGWAS